MRLACLPVALITVLLPFSTSATQVSWDPSRQTSSSVTLVDALSADPDYTSLLRLFQRARLIPTLNRLNGSTLFAPTNSAIKRHTSRPSLWKSILDDDTFIVTDNVQEKLRQQLFYHLLNYTLPKSRTGDKLQVHKTLLFPSISSNPSPQDPPPNPPWMPIPGGSLGGEPQRLRISAHADGIRVGVDFSGEGGADVTKGLQDAGNGILFGISEVLEPPVDLAEVVFQQSSLSYLYKIFGNETVRRLSATANLTLFLPVNQAWDELDPLEKLYLESEFATADLNRILDMHAVVQESVIWSDSFGPALNLTSLDGSTLEIVITPNGTRVSDANLLHPDIYASNGVLHLVSSLLVPPDALKLTPEKYLLALNCTTFVSLLHSVEFTQFINDTATQYTILAPRDDILSVFGEAELPERGSEELKRLLQYHFIPGRWTPKKLEDGLLLETALEEEGLGGNRQVLGIEVNSDSPKKGNKSIRFSGAAVIGDPIQVNNTIIYFISRPLLPPSDLLETALPYLELSSFLAAILSSSQADVLRATARTSLLIPHNQAFMRLGLLVSRHLLSPSSKQDLENVLLHHTLNSVEYTPALLGGAQHTFATLEGSDVTFERSTNGTLFVSSSGGWAGMKAELFPRNILTQTGVIHELSDILIPRSVQLTIGKLVKVAKASTMATLVNKAGFDWVLNGTAPPEGSSWAEENRNGLGWTLLCPTDDAFKHYNLTELYADVEGLQTIVMQHLIPIPFSQSGLSGDDKPLNNNQPLILDDATYSTLRSSVSAYGDVAFRKRTDGNEYIVGIKGARGTNGEADWARVLAWGRSTTGNGVGGVLQIDKLLVPYQPQWWIEYGGPSAVGTVGILFICAFFYGVRTIWKRDTTEATYEPVGGFGRDDDD